jgi:corrinoid protein of di/trimethylamine methyltransferase
MATIDEISVQLQAGKAKVVKQLVAAAVEEGFSAQDILENGLLHGMGIIGEKFKNNEVFVPEVLVAARAMNMGVEVLKPLLQEAGVKAAGKVCIGTVEGDLHDIGKNLVRLMMEGKGIEVIDLGTDVLPETFVQAAVENECQVICCSALLTTTMHVMKDVVEAVEKAGLRNKVKIMVGGAPITQAFCEQIGADYYTPDATTAAIQAAKLCRSAG